MTSIESSELVSLGSAKVLGFWSAVLATIFSLAYVVGQLAEWAGLMGSGGGAENASTPLGLIVLLTPSLFLAPAFLVMILAVKEIATADRRIFGNAAVAFASIYAVMVSINYFVQLTWVAPRFCHATKSLCQASGAPCP